MHCFQAIDFRNNAAFYVDNRSIDFVVILSGNNKRFVYFTMCYAVNIGLFPTRFHQYLNESNGSTSILQISEKKKIPHSSDDHTPHTRIEWYELFMRYESIISFEWFHFRWNVFHINMLCYVSLWRSNNHLWKCWILSIFQNFILAISKKSTWKNRRSSTNSNERIFLNKLIVWL